MGNGGRADRTDNEAGRKCARGNNDDATGTDWFTLFTRRCSTVAVEVWMEVQLCGLVAIFNSS